GTCYAAGNAGTILKTTNGGQLWSTATSGTTTNLSAISCFGTNACVTVGAVASGAAVVRSTLDGTAWNAATGTGTQALNGVSCVAGACLAVGAAGTAIYSTSLGGTWTVSPTGTTNALNAVTCLPSTACYAVGAGGTILKFPSVASPPSPLTSGTTQALNGVACVNASFCFADGATGTTIATPDGGTTWGQQGNPISGPPSAINATNIALNGAGCNAGRCFVGLGAQGDILTTPLLTVTVHTSGVYGSTPSISLPADSASIAYSPAAQAGNVTGTLTCTTSAA